jgi:hypothetical protein
MSSETRHARAIVEAAVEADRRVHAVASSISIGVSDIESMYGAGARWPNASSSRVPKAGAVM